jgi:hypothetical protein
MTQPPAAPARVARSTTALRAPHAGCPVSHKAAAFDPFEDGYQQDPPEYVRWAREQEPVFYSPKLGYWVVTRYDDIKAIFRDNITFSPSIALEKITPTGEEANAVLASYGYAMNRTLVNEDEPAHMPRRRALMEPFTPAELAHHEPMVRRLAREYVDRFIDDGRADLVDQMLWEVPLTVALHFLGVPEEDMDLLRQYSIAHTVNTWGRPKPEEQVAVAHAVGNFWQLAGRILDKMREDPSGPGWMQYGMRKQRTARGGHRLLPALDDDGRHRGRARDHGQCHGQRDQAAAAASRRLARDLRGPGADSQRRGGMPAPQRLGGRLAAPRHARHRSGRHVARGGQQIADRHVVGQPRRAAFRRCRSVRHPPRQRQRPADLRLWLAPVHGQEPRAHGNADLPGGVDRRLPICGWPSSASPTCPTPRSAARASVGGMGPGAQPRARRPDGAGAARCGAHRRALAAPPAARSLSSASNRRADVLDPPGFARWRALPRWSPGSHIDVECGDTGISRQYSLCGDPADTSAFEIAVLREPESRGGSAWIHASLRAGDKLKVRGPRNRFRLDEPAARDLHRRWHRRHAGQRHGAAMRKNWASTTRSTIAAAARASMALLDDLRALHGDRVRIPYR